MEDDLISVRGLVDSDFEEDLREFEGTFKGHEKVPASGYSGWRVNLHYADIDNVVAAPGKVYNFPTKVLNLPLSDKTKSKWGYFGKSLGALEPPDEDIGDWKEQRHKLVYCDGVDGRPEPKLIYSKRAKEAWQFSLSLGAKIKTEQDQEIKDALQKELEELGEVYENGMSPTPVWIVVEVDGRAGLEELGAAAEAVDIAAYAEELLIGKTRAQFNKAAFADPVIRKDTGLQRSITDKSFVSSLIQLGRVAENADGVFEKVA